jgi:hypothetical protein
MSAVENYIVQVVAKPGHESQVADFYQSAWTLLKFEKGFRGRKVFRVQ